jgi:hypothetical protein
MQLDSELQLPNGRLEGFGQVAHDLQGNPQCSA